MRAPRRQKGVEAQDEHAMAVEELEHALDDAGRVDRLRLELLHDVEELAKPHAHAKGRVRQVSCRGVTKPWHPVGEVSDVWRA